MAPRSLNRASYKICSLNQSLSVVRRDTSSKGTMSENLGRQIWIVGGRLSVEVLLTASAATRSPVTAAACKVCSLALSCRACAPQVICGVAIAALKRLPVSA